MQQVEDLGAGPPLQISVPTAREDKTQRQPREQPALPSAACVLYQLQEEGQSPGPPKLITRAQPFLSEPLVTLSVLASCHPGTILFAPVPSPQQGTAPSLQAEVAKHRQTPGDTATRPGRGMPGVGAVQPRPAVQGLMSCSLGSWLVAFGCFP